MLQVIKTFSSAGLAKYKNWAQWQIYAWYTTPVCSSPRIIILLLRIIEKIRLGTPKSFTVTPTPNRANKTRLRPCPVEFWVSLKMKIPQPLSVPGPVFDHPHDKKAHNLFPYTKSEFPMLPRSCHHLLPEQSGSIFSVHSPQVLEEGRKILKTSPPKWGTLHWGGGRWLLKHCNVCW